MIQCLWRHTPKKYPLGELKVVSYIDPALSQIDFRIDSSLSFFDLSLAVQ